MPPKKSSNDEGKYASMTVLELKKVCKAKTGMKTKDCNLLRKPLVELLLSLDAKENRSEPKKKSGSGTSKKSSKTSSRTASPSPSRSQSKSGRDYSAGKCKHDSCPDKFCVIASGACIGKTKKGTPLVAELTKIGKMNATLRKEILSTDDGLLGTESEIRALRKSGSGSKKSRTPSPKKSPVPKKASKKTKSPAKKVSSKSKCYEPEADDCDSGKICSAKSGRCIKDTPAARRNMKVLMVDGREIVGSEDIIKRLQTQIGGKIQGMAEEDSDDESSSIVFETRRDDPSATLPYEDESSSDAPAPYESDEDSSSSEVIIPVVVPSKTARRGTTPAPKTKTPPRRDPTPKRDSPVGRTPKTRELGNSATQLRRRDIQETFMACLNSLK